MRKEYRTPCIHYELKWVPETVTVLTGSLRTCRLLGRFLHRSCFLHAGELPQDLPADLFHLRGRCASGQFAPCETLAEEEHHQALEGIGDGSSPLLSAGEDHRLRHDIHSGGFHRVGEARHDVLDDLVPRPAVSLDLLPGGDGSGNPHAGFPVRFGLSHGADLVSVRLGESLDLFRILAGFHQVGFSLIFLDPDIYVGFGQVGLLLGDRFRFPEFPFLHGGVLLVLIGFELLFGQLPGAELGEDLLDVGVVAGTGGGADEDFFEFQVIVGEFVFHLFRGEVLDFVPLLEQLDEGLRLSDVLEVRGDHRVEGLVDEHLDVPEALDDQGRFAVVDVEDHGQGQGRLEGVFCDEVHLDEVGVVVVDAALVADPFEDDVGGGDFDDAARIGVEGVFPGHEGDGPDSPETREDQFAVFVVHAGAVFAFLAGVGDDHADKADGDDGFGDGLDGGEEAVDEVGPVCEDLVLSASVSSCGEEVFGVLEVVVVVFRGGVVPDGGGDDVVLSQGGSVVDGDDAYEVAFSLDEDGVEAVAVFDLFGHG